MSCTVFCQALTERLRLTVATFTIIDYDPCLSIFQSLNKRIGPLSVLFKVTRQPARGQRSTVGCLDSGYGVIATES
jgi:hypothetical protein